MTATANRSRASERLRAFALAGLSGVGLGSAWPGGPLPAMALFFLVPFLCAIRDATALHRMLLGACAGTVSAWISAGEPTISTLESYFELRGGPLAAAVLLATGTLGALPFAVFGLLVGRLAHASAAVAFAGVGAAWVVTEMLRALLFPGPWLSLASALTPLPMLLQSAEWFGERGVSFWVAGIGALAHRGLLGPSRRQAWLAGSLVALALLAQVKWSSHDLRALGSIELDSEPSKNFGGLRVALVQSGMDSRMRSERPTDAADLHELIAISASSGPPVDLLVWPEGALRGVWPANAGLLDDRQMHDLRARHLLFGAPWIDDAPSDASLGVAAILLDETGRIAGRHLKTRLVPLAEDGQVGGRHFAGEKRATYSSVTNGDRLSVSGIELGVSICYEVLFEDVARRQAADGAGVLVHLSNESWLGPTQRGQAHMLAAATLRAIETRRPVLRSTTTGETAAIDASGRQIAGLAPHGPGSLRLRVEPATRQTLHTRLGPYPVEIFALVVTAIRFARTSRTIDRPFPLTP